MTVSHPIRACALLLLLAVTAQTDSAAQPSPDGQDKTIARGGLTRTYRVHVPPSYDGKRPLPLVFVFHGGGGTNLAIERGTGFNPLADRQGFLVVYPQGVENHWNDGRIGARFPKATEIDDVGFIRVLIDQLQKDYTIDAERICATGLSNGGFFSHRLGWELSDRFAAIAPVAGTLDPDVARKFAPAHPVHVLDIHGTKDATVPFDGGDVAAQGGRCISVPAMMGLWARANGCKAEPKSEYLPEKDPADGIRVRRETYEPRPMGADVVLYVGEGLGHVWPGAARRDATKSAGTREIDATELISQFFAGHPKVRTRAPH